MYVEISLLFSSPIIIRVALIAATILRIFHIERSILPFHVNLRDAHFDESIESLLLVRRHLQTSSHFLPAVHTHRLCEEKECLVPVGGFVVGTRVEGGLFVDAVEKRAEVEDVAVEECSAGHHVIELHLEVLEVFYGAGLKVEDFSAGGETEQTFGFQRI